MSKKNYEDHSLEVAKELINSLREQFDIENEQIKQARLEMEMEKDFEVSKFYTYPGPNFYLDSKAIVFNLFIAKEGPKVNFFREKVAEIFPQVEQIETPYIVDLFAEVLLLVQKMDSNLYINKYSISNAKDEYVIAIEYWDEYIAEEAVYLVSDWFKAIADDEAFNMRSEFRKLQADFNNTILGDPTTCALVEEGLKNKIPVTYLQEENQFMWGYGKKQLRGRSTTFSTDGVEDSEFTLYKDMVAGFLEMCSLPTPKGQNCFTEDEAVEAAVNLGLPVVVKPATWHKGESKATGLNNEESVRKAFQKIINAADKESSSFEGALVQQQVHGIDYKLVTVDGKFAAASAEASKFIIGNGIDTIEKLIEAENTKESLPGNDQPSVLQITIDETLKSLLASQNLDLQSMPKQNQKIVLGIAEEGVSINATNKVHKDNIQLIEDIAAFFNVKCLGIDILASDISNSWKAGNFSIIEINANPSLLTHLNPTYGDSVNIPKLILESHFSVEKSGGRIPIIASNSGSSKITKAIYNQLAKIKADIFMGALTDDGVCFNNRLFCNNQDHSQNAKIILRHPKTEFAYFKHNKNNIYDYGTFHEGADIIILDNPSYAEEMVLKELLLPNGFVINILEHEIAMERDGQKVSSIPYTNEEDKIEKILTYIDYGTLKELLFKYE